jgi:hypothetical protein
VNSKRPKITKTQPKVKILRFLENLNGYTNVTLLKPMKAFPNYYMGSDPTSESWSGNRLMIARSGTL